MTTDTDTLVALAALQDKVTDEDLHESGRYFHDRSFGDLTRCSHGDTGNFDIPDDGKAIAILWNFWRAGGFDRIEALEAEVARCHARLEITHVGKMKGDGTADLIRVEVPMAERATMPDGIDARDATIGRN